ncbi:hypothetical protein GZ77_08220 [Endozoicomonas montiporae]|uniref:Entry exclusion lipoprotein TrbK n=2 Tax=Endozoicomonas montiporae TaxID=1027273 RepID=A0A081N7E1_9GAMM|nr:hypothetical protein [Endozoicomonas montiporae]AMO55796.1 hypothetical protein EZMO1_1645 [Endozoicomonas montiporae CL-33]KEQ14364.1 hypothetical protein GZ77_08220 [Endozoicomonas montiporae]
MRILSKYNVRFCSLVLNAFLLVLGGCATDFSDLDEPEAKKEKCPENWCKEQTLDDAITIEQKRNENKRLKSKRSDGKPVPGIYHPLTHWPVHRTESEKRRTGWH